MARLRRSDCSQPGIRRRRRGGGFSYTGAGGATVDDADRERIAGLAIPPAWREVWICPDPAGHIQATGYDDAGRKQYLYHERWRRQRDRQKFDQMLDFGAALDGLRDSVRRDLRRRGLVEARVLGCAIRILDVGLLRIGSERYAEENETYGLATLQRRHLSLHRGRIILRYTAKGDRHEVRELEDPLLLPVLRTLLGRSGGGRRLLVYRNGGGWSQVRSEQINAYLKERAGEPFTAKDFRTWNATVLAALFLAREPQELSAAGRERAIRATVGRVAEFLGNTPTVARSSYIDPRVFDRFRDAQSIRGDLPANLGSSEGLPRRRAGVEAAVRSLLA